MAYGFKSRLFLEDGPAIRSERAGYARSAGAARAWRGLSEQTRLELIEKALDKPANDDMPDGLPVAL